MKSGILIPMCSLAGALLLTSACQQRNDAEDIAKTKRESADEIARIRREADEKIAAAQREAEQKIAAARTEAAKDIADTNKEAVKDIAKEQRDLEQELQRAKQDTLDEYRDYVKKRVRLFELREAAAMAAATPGTPEHTRYKQDLDTRRSTLQASLNDLDKATTNTWQTVKTKLDTELREFEATLDRIDRAPSTRAKR